MDFKVQERLPDAVCHRYSIFPRKLSSLRERLGA